MSTVINDLLYPQQVGNVHLAVILLFFQIVLTICIAGLVKQLAPDVPVLFILFCRYFFCLPLLLLLGWFQRGRNLFQINQTGVLLKRIITGLLGLYFWFLAVIYLTLSTATVLSQTMPIFITLLAPFLTSETIGVRRIAAVFVGFLGVVILINPSWDGSSAYPALGLLFGLAAPFFGALMFIFLRVLGSGDAPISTSIWHNLVGSILFGILFLINGEGLPDLSFDNGIIWTFLIVIGVASSFQQFTMALSHKLASATVLAPVHYSSIPVSVVIGIVFFGDNIDARFIVGTIIIIGSTWYIFLRERKKDLVDLR